MKRHDSEIGLVRVVLGAGDQEIRQAIELPDDMVILNPDWSAASSPPSKPRCAISPRIRSPKTPSTGFCLAGRPSARQPRVVDDLADAFYYLGQPIAVPTFHGRRGHPIIFARSLFPELLAAPDDFGARAVVWAHAADVIEVPTEEEGVVLNLNDPDTLRRARGDK